MSEALIAHIRQAFASMVYPGDRFLLGSNEGCEPYDEVSQFFGCTDWTALAPEMLDARYCALSFFSEIGFRFFLPAYLIADVRQQLRTADPVFHLTHGFYRFSHDYQGHTRSFTRSVGGSTLINPRRYGGTSWEDHYRFRLAVFCREEAAAIVDYLEFRKRLDEFDAPAIEAALSAFWYRRAAVAPTAAEIEAAIVEEDEFAADLTQKFSRTAGVTDRLPEKPEP
jgi:hypothetical protein